MLATIGHAVVNLPCHVRIGAPSCDLDVLHGRAEGWRIGHSADHVVDLQSLTAPCELLDVGNWKRGTSNAGELAVIVEKAAVSCS